MGQFQPVHASGHVDVRKKHRDVSSRFNVLGRTSAHPKEVSLRTPCPVLSVVLTTEQHPRVREGRSSVKSAVGELFCSDSREERSDNPVKALAEI
jgi:hypothetical protein